MDSQRGVPRSPGTHAARRATRDRGQARSEDDDERAIRKAVLGNAERVSNPRRFKNVVAHSSELLRLVSDRIIPLILPVNLTSLALVYVFKIINQTGMPFMVKYRHKDGSRGVHTLGLGFLGIPEVWMTYTKQSQLDVFRDIVRGSLGMATTIARMGFVHAQRVSGERLASLKDAETPPRMIRKIGLFLSDNVQCVRLRVYERGEQPPGDATPRHMPRRPCPNCMSARLRSLCV